MRNNNKKNKKKPIEIVYAEDIGQLHIKVIFNDGIEQILDIGSYIRKHPNPMYNKYLDPELFHNFTLKWGRLYWGEPSKLDFHMESYYYNDLEHKLDYL